jgi:hypothetical protein
MPIIEYHTKFSVVSLSTVIVTVILAILIIMTIFFNSVQKLLVTGLKAIRIFLFGTRHNVCQQTEAHERSINVFIHKLTLIRVPTLCLA